MAGTTAYPGALDDNTNLNENLADNVDTVAAAHQNNQNAAIKELQQKVGITASTATTTKILIGGASAGTSAWCTVSGDATISNSGAVTVADNSHAHNATTLTGLGNWKALHTNGSGATTELAVGATGTVFKGQGTSAAPVFETVTTTEVDGGNWKVLYTDGSGDVNELALGASGTVLTGGGTSSAPTFAAPAAVTATTINGGNHKVLYTDGSGDVTELALGAAGTVLAANGTTSAPAFENITATDINGGNWKVFYTNGSGDVTEVTLGADGTVLQSNGATSAPTFESAGGGDDLIVSRSFGMRQGTNPAAIVEDGSRGVWGYSNNWYTD
jgi:hypothetical protein